MIKLSPEGGESAGGVETFQWSSSEQVYPFEEAADGSTLYCKEVDCGVVPSAGAQQTPHNISGYNPTKLHRIDGVVIPSVLGVNEQFARNLPHSQDASTFSIGTGIHETTVEVVTWHTHFASQGLKAIVRIIYGK